MLQERAGHQRRPRRHAACSNAYGVTVTETAPGELLLDPSNVREAHFAEIDAHAGSSRIPILFCGPLLHRLGEAFIPDLGGCRIGDRPIDFHLDALRAFGAIVDKSYEGFRLTAPNGLKGAKIELPYPSVGATEQVLLTAVRAEGVTELKNAAIEPEIMDLIAILQKMGAIITVEPNRVIYIEGVESLSGYTHRALFDRNEAASWASAALATEGDIFVGGASQQELMTFLNIFRKVGGAFEIHDDGIRFYHPGGELKPVVIETDVHPGLHDRLAAAARRRADQGAGRVDRARDRVREAVRLHGCADRHGRRHRHAQRGPRRSRRAGSAAASSSRPRSSPDRRRCTAPTSTVPDLRGGFSHLIAALTAEGTSTISNVGIISRGYEHFIDKLALLGADFVYEG